jgi:hypothetical protein
MLNRLEVLVGQTHPAKADVDRLNGIGFEWKALAVKEQQNASTSVNEDGIAMTTGRRMMKTAEVLPAAATAEWKRYLSRRYSLSRLFLRQVLTLFEDEGCGCYYVPVYLGVPCPLARVELLCQRRGQLSPRTGQECGQRNSVRL